MDIIGMIKKNDMLKVVLILLAVYFFMKYYNRESLENVESAPELAQPPVEVVAEAPVLQPAEQQAQVERAVAGTAQLNASELLPVYDEANEFAQQNPVSKLLQEQNFLQAGYHMGIQTQIQANKIGYHDIRSVPPIPKQDVGPFNNSSYEQPMGAGRRYLEIGS